MGKIGQNFSCHRNQSWVYGAKKLFCPNDLKFSTLVYLLIRNIFCKNYKIRLKIKKVIASQSFKTVLMAARLPQAELGVEL